MTDEEEMKEFAQRIKSMGIENPITVEDKITTDQLCECRYDLAELLEYAGFGSHHLQKAMKKFDDPENSEAVALSLAQTQAQTAAHAFRSVERIAKQLADACWEWSQYQQNTEL